MGFKVRWSRYGARQSEYQHGPHLNHGPLGSSVLLALMGLSVAVALQLQAEYGIDCVIICGLCLLFPS